MDIPQVSPRYGGPMVLEQLMQPNSQCLSDLAALSGMAA